MRKILTLLALIPSLALIATPFTAQAVVNSINGQTAANQLLTTPGSNAANSMHMEIIQQGNDTNRFRWDGSPWRVNQGGTGLTTSPLLGQILVGDGLGGYSLIETSSLGFVPYTGGTEDVNLGDDFGLVARSVDLSEGVTFNGDLIFGGQSLNLIDEFSGSEITVTLPGPNSIAFSGDNVGTTTVVFGSIGQVVSRACFNTKNTDGDDISFYFVGTTMVVENNLCQ